MKLYSYVVARDFGFAPNPFYGICTLATCKPRIRNVAERGDWVVGTGSKENDREKNIVYAMKVSDHMPFDDYWKSPTFQKKKPNLRGSKKQAFGDNIYHRNRKTGAWIQVDSHHSYEGGVINQENIETDTQANRVLIGESFIYWGGVGPRIPERFFDFGTSHETVAAKRNHRSNFSSKLVDEFVGWIGSFNERGYLADPLDWKRTP